VTVSAGGRVRVDRNQFTAGGVVIQFPRNFPYLPAVILGAVIMELLDSSTPLISLPAVAIDTETTGLDPSHARVVQLAAIRIDGTIISDETPVEHLVNPGIAIPKKSTAIQHISYSDVEDEQAIRTVWEEFEAFAGPRFVIGYRTGYDI
jgi:DNA polymerase-3 subunit epsilon/CBS domain-containing protein